jgi:hypothetical protein
MLDPHADPRTEDTLAYDLLAASGGAEPAVVGRATFRAGEVRVDGPENIRVAVEEQLSRPFVDRIRADERPRGYRRTGRGTVPAIVTPDSTDVGPPVTDPVIRRATLGRADETINARPLVITHPPDTGIRPIGDEGRPAAGTVGRSDCGWLV